jgi:hypothetical protein
VFPWICSSQAQTQNSLRYFRPFIFKRLSKQVLNALKTKNPALLCWVLFVTSRVEKSNFYEDLNLIVIENEF